MTARSIEIRHVSEHSAAVDRFEELYLRAGRCGNRVLVVVPAAPHRKLTNPYA